MVAYMAAPGCTFFKGRITEYNLDTFERVCKVYNKDPEIVFKNNKVRKREFVIIRQITSTLFVLKLGFTLNAAASFFGGQNHATVLHSIRTVKNLLDTDIEFRKLTGYLFEGVKMPKNKKYIGYKIH